MAPTAPSPVTWTMRFKHGKKTVVLHVDPLSPFVDIKAELLRSLHLTHPNGSLTPRVQIATQPSDVLLARPVDKDDYTRGWIRLRTDATEVEEDGDAALKEMQADEDSKKGGKGKSKRVELPDTNPKAAGLRDGCELAFRFRSEPKPDDSAVPGAEGEAWDVIQLTYDDVVAPQLEEDEGLVPDLGS